MKTLPKIMNHIRFACNPINLIAVLGIALSIAAAQPATAATVPVTSGLVLQLDASAASSMTLSGATVTEWRDELGSANKMSPGAGSPTLVAAGINGIPTVHFNTSSWMSDGVNRSAGPVTILYVSRETGGTNARVLSARNGNWLCGYWSGQRSAFYFEGWVTQGPASDTAPHLFAATIGGSGQNSTVYAEGVQVASNTSGTSGPNSLELNGSNGGGEMSDCDFSEVLVYNRILSAGELDSVGGYLTVKYGLTTFYPTTPQAKIFTFGPGGVIGSVSSNAATIAWTVPFGSSKASLSPTFTLATGATCKVNGNPVVSGATFDFTNPVNYVVTSSDSLITNTYTVTVTVAPNETTLIWNAGSGAWDLSSPNWKGQSSGLSGLPFLNGKNAIFDNTGSGGTITIAAGMSPASTTVSNVNYIFSGQPIAAGSLTKSGTGTLELDVTPANFSSIVLNGGTLYVQAANHFAFGSPFNINNVTVNSGATLEGERAYMVGGTLTMNGGTYWEDNGFGGGWTGLVYLGADSFFGQTGWCMPQTITGVISGPGGLTINSGTAGAWITLNTSNTYTGNTIITGTGGVVLGAGGSINTTPRISIGTGTTFDVSAKTSPYTWSTSTTLAAAGTASASTLKGASGGTINMGSQPIVLAYDGSHAALTVSPGTLSLNANPFTVNGSTLLTGAYNIVSQTTGAISTSGTFPSVSGTAIPAGKVGYLTTSGTTPGYLVLNIGAPAPTVSGFPSSQTAGAAGSVTVTAKDPIGNTFTAYAGTVHFTSSDGVAVLPADYTFLPTDNGTHIVSVTLKTAGAQSITATDSVTAVASSQTGITVTPAGATSLTVSGFPAAKVQGVAGNVTVTAKDAYGNTATGYRGTVSLSSSDGAATFSPSSYAFQAGDNGTKSFSVTLNTLSPPTFSITATDTVTGTITGTESGISVLTGTSAASLAVSGFPSPQTAGVAGSVTVTAKTLGGSTVTGYTGTIHFTSSDTYPAALPADYTFQPSDNGTHTFTGGVTLKTAGTRAITATDAGNAITGTQSAISVTPAGAATLTVAGFPSPQFAGTAGNVSVTAKDTYGNTATGYTGTIHFTSADGAAVLPSGYTFVGGDNGVHAFTGGVTFNTVGTQNIIATDTVTGTITGIQSGITVNLVPSIFSWATATAGNWSAASNWTNNAGLVLAPAAAGSAKYVLSFNQAGTYTSSHDLNNGFLLNQLNLASAVTITGNSLAFSTNGAVLPQLNQNSSSAIAVSAPLVLNANLTFGGSGSGTVALSGAISGGGTLIKTCSGSMTLSGPSTYSGGTTVTAGALTLGSTDNTLLGTGTVTAASGTTLNLNGNNNLTNAFVLNGGTVTDGNSFSANLNGPITFGATTTFDLGTTGNMTLGGAASGAGGLIKLGIAAGPLVLAGANSFTGPVTVSAGTLQFASLNSVSGGTATSNLGAPSTVTNGTISLGATTTAASLTYNGPGETTDRVIKMAGTTGGATLSQSGTIAGLPTTRGVSGLLKFTSDLTIPGTASVDNRKTLTLTSTATGTTGSIPGSGEINGSISDSVAGTTNQKATSVTKAGPNTWILSGNNTYTGTTSVQAGVLAFTRPTALGGGTLTLSAGAKTQLDFIGTRQIAGLTLNGISQANGTYGSSSSIALNKNDTWFSGLGTVTVGVIANPTTTTLALTNGVNPSAGGVALTFTATVSGTSPTGSVAFYDGLTLIGTGTLNGSFQTSFTTSYLTAGAHSITALYGGSVGNATSASVGLVQNVTETRPATTITLTSGGNPSNYGSAVTFTATVNGASPTGSATFYNGASILGTGTLNGSGQAILTTRGLTPGWRAISASYLGDANNAPSGPTSSLFQTVNPPPGNGKVKVFILAGQSNMQGKGVIETGRDPNNFANTSLAGGLGSLRNMLNKNPNKYGYLADPANPVGGNPGWIARSDVWITYWSDPGTGENRRGNLDTNFGNIGEGSRLGPEYGFGLEVGSQLADRVLLIKYAFGGKSLAVDYRPPGAVTARGGVVGPYYTGMVGTVHQVLNNLATYFPVYTGGGYEIVGLGWHQGYNDRVNSTYVAEYEANLTNLIKDLRTEFGVPNMPVSIGNTGMANAPSGPGSLIEAQGNVADPVKHPEFAGTVVTVDTRPYDYGQALGASSEDYHWYWNSESYFNIGADMGKAIMSLLPPVNALPTATAQSVTTPESTAKPITLSGTDPENSPLTYVIVAQPAHGTLGGTVPNITYTPVANYYGPDSFTFKANDGVYDSDAATISITVSPSPFSSWALDPAKGLTAGVNNGRLDDPDHDGICNLLEFALGGAPMTSSQAILPKLTKSGATWLFEYNRSNLALPPATTQVVEYGSNLTGWTPIAIPATSAGAVTITPGTPSDHVSVAIPNLGNQTFVRLKVSQ